MARGNWVVTGSHLDTSKLSHFKCANKIKKPSMKGRRVADEDNRGDETPSMQYRTNSRRCCTTSTKRTSVSLQGLLP